MLVRRLGALTVVLSFLVLAVPAAAQEDEGQEGDQQPTLVDCIGRSAAPEIYGATDSNAQSGNGGLSVAFNDVGTVSVLRWPSPSYYDQVHYLTGSRDEENLGVAPTDGIFSGLVVETAAGTEVSWLRDWSTTQRHAPGFSDEVITTHRHDDLGLEVQVRDVVAHPDDVLVREVVVDREAGSPVERARLITYENLSLVVSKLPLLPVQDWCFDDSNHDRARYDAELDAIVHELDGEDESTGEASSVAIGVAYASASDGHQVGADALADASDGELDGAASFEGPTTGVLATPLDLDGDSASQLLIVAAGADSAAVTELVSSYRSRTFDEVASTKQAWLDELLGDAPMPATDSEAMLRLARRALVTLVTDRDRETGAIVASIATQSPYGEDWPRDGAFFDYALDVIGLHDWVTQHHDFYAAAQQTPDDPIPTLTGLGVPDGNWGMNYYADGVVGGPIPWEIDETGYTLWNLWEHGALVGDEQLAAVYPTIELAADFLVSCTDEETGLQCPALEDDNLDLRQTIVGAGTVWLGLDAATNTAERLGHTDDAARWGTRRDELAAAIDEHLWDEEREAWGNGDAPLVWPACYRPFDDEQMALHLEQAWEKTEPTFAEPGAGEKERGQYEAKALLALAKAWRDDPERLEQVRQGILWIAEEHATPDTNIMGEAWVLRDGEVISVVSQPHAWEQVLVYLAALEAWPPEGVEPEPGCGGALAALRTNDTEGDTPTDQAAPDSQTAVDEGSSTSPAVIALGVAAAALVLGAAFWLFRRRATTGVK